MRSVLTLPTKKKFFLNEPVMQHLILTGFMGVGKSTLAPLIASHLGRLWLDSDRKFEKESGLHPSAYIRRFGVAPFRKWESRFLKEIPDHPPLVLATGGGMILNDTNRRWMRAKGCLIWLDAPLPLLLQRLEKKRLRPMLPVPLTLANLQRLFRERRPFYRKCHLKIGHAFEGPEKVAIQVCRRYKEWNRHAPGSSE